MLILRLCTKAEARDKEKMKEENRRMKKLENAFRTLLKTKEIDHMAVWEESRPKLEEDPAFESITLESERIRIFKVNSMFIFYLYKKTHSFLKEFW